MPEGLGFDGRGEKLLEQLTVLAAHQAQRAMVPPLANLPPRGLRNGQLRLTHHPPQPSIWRCPPHSAAVNLTPADLGIAQK